MIYLIESGNYVKIGYTNNFLHRMSCYESHNPDCTLISYCMGGRELEKELHQKFKDIRYKREWFYKTDEIVHCLDELRAIPIDTIKQDLQDYLDQLETRIIDTIFEKGNPNSIWIGWISKDMENKLSDVCQLNQDDLELKLLQKRMDAYKNFTLHVNIPGSYVLSDKHIIEIRRRYTNDCWETRYLLIS